VATGLRVLDLDTGGASDVRLSTDRLPDASVLPDGKLRTFPGPGGRPVHAVVYPPRNPDFAAPRDELPPYVALVHGGPTAHVQPEASTQVAFFTSRGIGVVDVNYGGSTGYGRAYRDRLRGQWGIVDVEDTVAAVLGLADAGIADRRRLAIQGGSAGGWTVLSALTTTDVFACGVSYFGVAELLQFAQETHDFESHYLDSLIGPLPEAGALYDQRAPVNNVEGLSCPVLLLQGLDDPVVPPSQAERFIAALRRKRLPYGYRAYPGESHGFRRAETIVDALEAELSFYGQVLGFDPPGIPVLELHRP
jgi:dipeptidyl aminopeptidase/acylaminoacyl peptidase